MFILIVFSLCLSFFIFVKENQLPYNKHEIKYTQDQLKGLAAFVRSHDDFSSVDIESGLGISSTFFNNSISVKNLPNSRYVTFDCTYLMYKKFLKIKQKTEQDTKIGCFFDTEFQILINNHIISKYDLLYYSNFLIFNKNPIKHLNCHYFPNLNAIVEDYLI